jgi:hypothetical protein
MKKSNRKREEVISTSMETAMEISILHLVLLELMVLYGTMMI